MTGLRIAAIALALAAEAQAESAALTGDEIGALLPTIFFDHKGTVQDFAADGRTWMVFRNSARTPGTWWVDGDLYCERFPPEDAARCFHIRPGRTDGSRPDRFLTLVDPSGPRHTITIGTR